jgi:hypothetical protein
VVTEISKSCIAHVMCYSTLGRQNYSAARPGCPRKRTVESSRPLLPAPPRPPCFLG